MPIYAIPFAVSTVAYFVLGLWIIYRQRNEVQQLYGILCVTTCFWQGIWAILFARFSLESSYLWLKICYTAIVFIPAVFYHFISVFTGEKSVTKSLRFLYGMCTVLAISVWIKGAFINGFYEHPWGVSARAGWLHPVFAVLVALVIGRILILLSRLEKMKDSADTKRRQIRLVKIATLLYCGGSIDILSNYGIHVFPLSSIFLGSAVLLFTYAILKYEFLSIAAPREDEDDVRRREAASQEMKRLGMVAAFPLVSQGELLGYLLLGEKMSEESYSKEDLLLLRIVANQAALAYQRVRYLEMAVHGARTEMLGEIAGGFAHEIKTPLANISLPAELSLMDLADLEQGRKRVEDILPELKLRLKDIMQQTFKASEKIEAIRQFSKPGQVKLESVDLAAVVRNSLQLLDHLLHKTNVKVSSDLPPSLASIRGDSKQLEIVFVNLIKNAAEAMAQHVSNALARDLQVRAQEEGNWIIVSVKDSGPGIRRTDFGHLFEAYFTTKGSEGTGMGLFLSRQVIKAHGGAIDVRSEEGKGTEFIIRLPKFAFQEQGRVHQAA